MPINYSTKTIVIGYTGKLQLQMPNGMLTDLMVVQFPNDNSPVKNQECMRELEAAFKGIVMILDSGLDGYGGNDKNGFQSVPNGPEAVFP